MTAESGGETTMTTSAANFRYPAIQGEEARRAELEVELEDETGPRAQTEDEYEFEDELEDEFEDEDFGGLARALGGYDARGGERDAEDEDELEGEFEFEYETEAERDARFETEDEYEEEAFVNPVRRIYRDAELMAHLSTRAAQAATEGEAEAFLGALVPMVGRLIPRAGKILASNAPTLIRGVSRLGQHLRRSPATRSYVATIPVILQRTAQSLADQSGSGRPIDPETVIRTLTTVASRVLRQPARRRQAARAVGIFDRRYHNRWGANAGRSPAPRGQSRPAARRARRRR
jgi:hypothetical protein